MNTETQITTKQTTGLSTNTASWVGQTLSTDTKVPRLLLMQALSKFVNEDKAKKGDIVKSTTTEKVGDTKTPVKLIVLSYPKNEWIIEVNTTGKPEYKKTLPRTAANENMPWKFTADKEGNEVPEGTRGSYPANRVRVASFFALLPNDLDKYVAEMEKANKGEFPDLSVRLSPIQIRCRGFSFEAALGISSFLDTVKRFGREPWEAIVELTSKESKNEKGHWYVFDFDQTKKPTPTPDKYKGAAKQAFDAVQTLGNTLVVDEAMEETESTDYTQNRQF